MPVRRPRNRRYPNPNPPHGGPPPPPPPPGSGGGGGKKGSKNGPRHRQRGQAIDAAVTRLSNALFDKGMSAPDANRFARMALSQKGVTIGRKGQIHYKGSLFKAEDFATSPLIQYVSGQKAKLANEAKIKADPNYQAALAGLALTRDQSQAGLDAQRRQALVDYGDPSFVQGDPVLQSAIKANQFGTSQLLHQAYQQNQQAATQAANVSGTLFGGGQASGQREAQRQFAGGSQQGITALQNLLSSLTLQGQQLSQSYGLGSQNALLQTQQNLADQGTLSASAPRFHIGRFRMFRPPRPPQPPRGVHPSGPRKRGPYGAGGGGIG